MSWIYLSVAIVAEVIATSALKVSDGFSRLGPTMISLAGYGLALWLLALALRVIPVGIAYAVWAGAGVVAIALIGYFVFHQTLNLPSVFGIGLILAGVVILNLFSGAGAH